MMPKGVEHRGFAAALNAFRHQSTRPRVTLLCSIQYPGFYFSYPAKIQAKLSTGAHDSHSTSP